MTRRVRKPLSAGQVLWRGAFALLGLAATLLALIVYGIKSMDGIGTLTTELDDAP